MSARSQSSNASSRDVYLSQFPNFLHSYIDNIVDVGDDGNYGFRAIAALHGWGEELDTQVHKHPHLFSNLFYDTISTITNMLRVEHLDVHGIDK